MKLIDKDAVTAKIERTIDEPYPKHDQQCDWEDGYCGGLYKALSIIEDTSDVKEVDFETAFATMIDVFDEKCGPHWCEEDLKEFAKHFFELGLKAHKGE